MGLLSFPSSSDPTGEVRFVLVPTKIRLKKQQAQRLDLTLDTMALNVAHRDPSAQEQEEEQRRLSSVLSDEVDEEEAEATLDYIDGEWQIRDPREGRSREGSHLGSREQSREPSES